MEIQKSWLSSRDTWEKIFKKKNENLTLNFSLQFQFASFFEVLKI